MAPPFGLRMSLTGMVFEVDIATGTILEHWPDGYPGTTVGLAVFGAQGQGGHCVDPPNTTMAAWYWIQRPAPIITSQNLATANTGTQFNGPLGIPGGKVGGAASFNGVNQLVPIPFLHRDRFWSGPNCDVLQR